jgi:hypothetical protein
VAIVVINRLSLACVVVNIGSGVKHVAAQSTAAGRKERCSIPVMMCMMMVVVCSTQ